jgi:hypothetical protein
VELSNNLAENSMRPVALGRKNWLHVGIPQAGPKVAAILSVVESCRRLGVPVKNYLAAVLPGLSRRTLPEVANLIPARWTVRRSQTNLGVGRNAYFIRRCQVHTKRNIVDHLPDEHKGDVRRRLQNAYAMADYADAKRALERLHRQLMNLNPSAARSLEEGMEETLTVHKLRVPAQLSRTLCCTNVIESAFSIVETVCRNVKRWRTGDQIERWVGSGSCAGRQR